MTCSSDDAMNDLTEKMEQLNLEYRESDLRPVQTRRQSMMTRIVSLNTIQHVNIHSDSDSRPNSSCRIQTRRQAQTTMAKSSQEMIPVEMTHQNENLSLESTSAQSSSEPLRPLATGRRFLTPLNIQTRSRASILKPKEDECQLPKLRNSSPLGIINPVHTRRNSLRLLLKCPTKINSEQIYQSIGDENEPQQSSQASGRRKLAFQNIQDMAKSIQSPALSHEHESAISTSTANTNQVKLETECNENTALGLGKRERENDCLKSVPEEPPGDTPVQSYKRRKQVHFCKEVRVFVLDLNESRSCTDWHKNLTKEGIISASMWKQELEEAEQTQTNEGDDKKTLVNEN